MGFFGSKRKENKPKNSTKSPTKDPQQGANVTPIQLKLPSGSALGSSRKTQIEVPPRVSPLPSPPLTPLPLSSTPTRQPVVEISEVATEYTTDGEKILQTPPPLEFPLTPPSLSPGFLAVADPMALGQNSPEAFRSNVDIRDTLYRKDREPEVSVPSELMQELEEDVPWDEEFDDPVLAKFKSAVQSFEDHYQPLAQTSPPSPNLKSNIRKAVAFAAKEKDIRLSAVQFRELLVETAKAYDTKQKAKEKQWTGKIMKFASKMYPLVRFTLQLAGTVSEGALFMPLKGAAVGLNIILEKVDAQSRKGSEFYHYLERIEYQSARLSANPHFNLANASSNILLRDKSVDLMTAIVSFFDSALLYFHSDIFGKIWDAVGKAEDNYQHGKNVVDVAIKEYDQAVFDYVSEISTTTALDVKEISIAIESLQFEQRATQKHQEQAQAKLEAQLRKKEAEEFVRWLAPSHQLVEAQLRIVRNQRKEGTLEWARIMPEFHTWRTSDLTSAKRVLWIQGTLGVGKSTMAGYLIELLKYSTPAPAIVAFFFCRSNQKGLTKAREIIRTIAYQCFYNNLMARRALEEKRSINYLTDDTVAIDPLFENLIGEPLRLIQQDVYFIVDGLDESDTEAMDEHGTRVKKSEMRVLVECFAKLPSARVLFISRPTPTISEVIKPSNMAVKRIEKSDNSADIDSYVQTTVSESQKLQGHFDALKVEPLEYFREHANSIFLWVVIVLTQLGKAKGRKAFEKTLNEFTKSGGAEIDKVYESMFQKVGEDDQEFVKEILRWPIYDQFTVAQLQGAVEWSLNDDFGESFRELLETHCGPMFHSVDKDSDTALQFIHETLRSYITVRANREAFYFVNEDTVKVDALIASLEVLTERGTERSKSGRFDAFKTYASKSWVDQLKKVIDSKLVSTAILSSLCKFFRSDACKDWVQQTLSRRSDFIFEYENNHFLGTLAKGPHNVYHFLVLWNADRIKREGTDGADGDVSHEDDDSLQEDDISQDEVSQWALEMLESPAKLGEYVGKVCVDILFNDDVEQNAVRPLFLSAIHYYCVRYDLNRCSIADIQGIANNGCSALFKWMGKANDNPASAKYLGLVLVMLQMWDEAEPWLRRAVEYEKSKGQETNDDLVDEGFVRACLRKDEFLDVIETVKPHIGTGSKWDIYRAIAYNATGNSEGAEEGFEKAMEEGETRPSRAWLTIQLLQIYIPKREWDKVISVCSRLLDGDPSIWWAWGILKDAYITKNDTAGIKEVQKQQRDRYPGLESDESAALLNSDPSNNQSDEPNSVEQTIASNQRRPSVNQLKLFEHYAKKLPTAPTIAEKYDEWLVIQNKNAPTQVDLVLQHEFEVFDDPTRIQFSDQGEYVAVACYQHRSVQVYCLKTGKLMGTYFHTQNDEILSSDPGSILAVPLQIDGLAMRFSPDAQELITTAVDLVIRVWDIRKGLVKRRFKGHTENITCLAISADGNYLAAGSGKKLLLWNLKAEGKHRSGREVDVATIDLDIGTKSIEFSPDSKLLAVKGDDQCIYLRGGKEWKELKKLNAVYLTGRGTRKAFRFSRDGTRLTWASHKMVRQWRLKYSGPDKVLDPDSPVESVESFELPCEEPKIGYNCSTEWVVTSYAESDLALYKFCDKQPVLTLCNTNGFIEISAWHGPDGELLFGTGSYDKDFGFGTVMIWKGVQVDSCSREESVEK